MGFPLEGGQKKQEGANICSVKVGGKRRAGQECLGDDTRTGTEYTSQSVS